MADKVTFLASFPPIQTAIKVDGQSGMRITLDIPETEIPEAIKLMLYRQIPLRVTIEPDVKEKPETGSANGTAGGRTLKRSTAKKRV